MEAHPAPAAGATISDQLLSIAKPPFDEETASLPSIVAHDTSDPPAIIKQEPIATPQPSSPIERRPSDADLHIPKSIATLKSEHSNVTRTQSPLRESSVPVPTTELPPSASQSTLLSSNNSKKRPAPAKTKKGTATVKKGGPPTKKRKLDGIKKDDAASGKIRSSGKLTPLGMSPAPSARSGHSGRLQNSDEDADSHVEDEEASDDDDDPEDDDPDADVYCLCRRPDNGTFMIGCDGSCDDWFHGKCVGIPEANKNLIERYICPNCTEAGRGRTSWKRMCRRPGCRQPTRTAGKNKDGKASKYCSDECGVLFFRAMTAKTRGRDEEDTRRAVRTSTNSARAKTTGSPQKTLGTARGGALAAGEIKALILGSTSVEAFHRLGQHPATAAAALSPPATPPEAPSGLAGSGSVLEDHAQEAAISGKKELARKRHALLKARMRFVGEVKANATRLAAERDIKARDFCGYDRRLEWGEEEFRAWWEAGDGQVSRERVTEGGAELANGHGKEHAGDMDDGEDEEPLVCARKRCLRHTEWPKLALDSLRAEISANGDTMRALEGDELALKERAFLRRIGRGEGRVERHQSEIGIVGETTAEIERSTNEEPFVAGEEMVGIVHADQQPEAEDQQNLDDTPIEGLDVAPEMDTIMAE